MTKEIEKQKGKLFLDENNKVVGSLYLSSLGYKNMPETDNYIEIELQEWTEFLDNNQSKDFFVEHGVLIAVDKIIAPDILLKLEIEENKRILDESDKYFIRKLDVGKEIPADIQTARDNARAFLEANEG